MVKFDNVRSMFLGMGMGMGMRIEMGMKFFVWLKEV